MGAETFQVRIGCVVPLVLGAELEGVAGIKCVNWHADKEGRWQAAIELECGLLEQTISPRTGDKVCVKTRLLLLDTAVTRIRMQKTKDGRHEIGEPNPCCWQKADVLQGAMVLFAWIPFPDNVYDALTGCQRKAHLNLRTKIAWFPRKARTYFPSCTPDEGLTHELKEWLANVAVKGTGMRLPGPHGGKDFYAYIRDNVTQQEIRCLAGKWHQAEQAW